MDLLMHLIEKNKINIYDIPIAKVTEQYLHYLDGFKEFNIEVASEFLLMAATLLQIKSRILLPKAKKIDEIDDDDEGVDPRQELVDRLLEYRRFKEVSNVLENLAEETSKMFFREPQKLKTHYLPIEGLDAKLLVQAFQTLLEVHQDESALITREHFSVKDKIYDIMNLLHRGNHKIAFTDAFTRAGTRAELIVTFLAVLELIKLKKIKIEQEFSFAPIYMRLNEIKECDIG